MPCPPERDKAFELRCKLFPEHDDYGRLKARYKLITNIHELPRPSNKLSVPNLSVKISDKGSLSLDPT